MGLLDQLRDEIRVRHYGLRTEKTYAHWVCRSVNAPAGLPPETSAPRPAA